MSDTPPERQGWPTVPPPRSGCLTAFMILVGLILLLPGLCALIFAFGAMTDSNLPPFRSLIALGLLAGFGGILLIWAAVRSPSR